MKIYRLVNKKGETVVQGSLEECQRREKDRLEYVGVSTPIYRATDNNGLDETGTMKELMAKLNLPMLTLYNYTRYARRGDGLYVQKVKEVIRKDED